MKARASDNNLPLLTFLNVPVCDAEPERCKMTEWLVAAIFWKTV
jgi:hypothetical protein